MELVTKTAQGDFALTNFTTPLTYETLLELARQTDNLVKKEKEYRLSLAQTALNGIIKHIKDQGFQIRTSELDGNQTSLYPDVFEVMH